MRLIVVGQEYLEQEIYRRHTHKSGEHTQNKHNVHHRLSCLEFHTAENVCYRKHEDCCDHTAADRDEKRIAVPLQKLRLCEKSFVIIKCPLLREEGRRPRAGLLTEGLNEEIEEGNDPYDRENGENYLSYGVAEDPSEAHTAATFFLFLAFLDLCFQLIDLLPVGQLLSVLINLYFILDLFTHWKLSSPFTAEDLL